MRYTQRRCLSPLALALPLATLASAQQRSDKAGLPWASQQYVPMTGFEGENSSVTWYYTWSPDPVVYSTYSSTYSPSFAFVPQIWGIDDTHTSDFLDALKNNFSSTARLPDWPILTYNEPDQPGQALCSPADAAAHWKEHLEPLRRVNGGNWTLASPAVTSAPRGKTWMNEFRGNCSGCDWDFTALHWYDTSSDDFLAYLDDFHASFGNKSLWITEFACVNFNPPYNQPNLSTISTFLDTVLPVMDSTSWISRYAWFAPAYDMQNVTNDASLLRNTTRDFSRRTGVPNALGVTFAGVNGTAEAEAKGAAGRRVSGGCGWLLAGAVVVAAGFAAV